MGITSFREAYAFFGSTCRELTSACEQVCCNASMEPVTLQPWKRLYHRMPSFSCKSNSLTLFIRDL